ncbi:hypothetical protein E2562_015916 [Oryza meyeriana var. granulata]|uniref:MINDY deubiquitinase domain-containing protein n=1 Tax=Oryza meyeriana var. granulata TaxID=110450 RepID=A0A6G1CGE8_9ORYZ|nr:hypothetical protein E2562_015916 [Oryza meyeriana var. granulata]
MGSIISRDRSFCELPTLEPNNLQMQRGDREEEVELYKGSLYLLATDQGFINQTDVVWQKLDKE